MSGKNVDDSECFGSLQPVVSPYGRSLVLLRLFPPAKKMIQMFP
jgi:hypothetical protein